MIAFALYQYREIEHLHRTIEFADRPKSDELSSLRAEYEVLLDAEKTRTEAYRRSSGEIKSLSAQIAALQQRLAEIREARSQPVSKYSAPRSQSGSSNPTMVDRDKILQNAGYKSPGAAVQTALWAWAHHDVDSILSSNVFDPEDEQDLGTVYARLPEHTQTLIHSPREMAALLVGRLSPPADSAPGIDVLSETQLGPDIVSVQFQWQSAVATPPITLQVRREEKAWKVVLPHSFAAEIAATALSIPPTQWEILTAQGHLTVSPSAVGTTR